MATVTSGSPQSAVRSPWSAAAPASLCSDSGLRTADKAVVEIDRCAIVLGDIGGAAGRGTQLRAIVRRQIEVRTQAAEQIARVRLEQQSMLETFVRQQFRDAADARRQKRQTVGGAFDYRERRIIGQRREDGQAVALVRIAQCLLAVVVRQQCIGSSRADSPGCIRGPSCRCRAC